MAADVASLAIRVESLEVSTADRRLGGLAASGGKAERATDGLTAGFARMIGPLAAVVSAGAALTKVIGIQREFDVLNAGLVTATGSSEKAAIAFEALTDFASKTPYSLQQAVDGFTKLVNLGLTPSERALLSYGNTASAMGKDLSQMIEAVADAATGEFERLKEFGIKAKQEGDKVSLTFRGTTTEIGNNAAEIEGYLMKLGENEFAGAMEKRMNSLDGAISNLGDSWNQLFLTVSQAGAGSVIEDGVRAATATVEELNAMLASGEMQQYLLAIASAWVDLGADARQAMAITADFVSDLFKRTGGDGKTFAGIVFETIAVLGANTLYVLKGIGNEIGGISAQLAALARGDFSGFKAIGQAMEEDAKRTRKEVDALTESILNPKQGGQATSEYQKHLDEAKRLREEWDKTRAARKAVGDDRLAPFKVGGSGGKATDKTDKAAEAARKKRETEFASLRESLLTEEEAIAASYAKRKAIIEANTAAGSGLRTDLMSRLDAEHAEKLKKLEIEQGAELEGLRTSLRTQEEVIQESYDKRMEIIRKSTLEGSTLRADMEARAGEDKSKALAEIEAQRQRERDGLYASLLTEEEALRQSYDRKKQLILDSELVTETERQDLLRRLKKQFDEETAASENKRMQTQLSNASSLFGGLADLAKTYGGEQSKAYKVLFAASKAFSIAQAAMAISTGMAEALKLGWPAGIAAMAGVAAQGAGILSQIKGSNYAGAYDEGGLIPAGKIGIVGEYGPELVKGPTNVTSRKDTAAMLENAGSQQAPQAAPQVNIRQINAFDVGVVGDFLGSDEGEEVIMNVVRRNKTTISSMAAGG